MTQDQVIAALNTAAENGYDMSQHTPEDIVADLLAYEVQAENDTAENLLPHVHAWLAQRKKD